MGDTKSEGGCIQGCSLLILAIVVPFLLLMAFGGDKMPWQPATPTPTPPPPIGRGVMWCPDCIEEFMPIYGCTWWGREECPGRLFSGERVEVLLQRETELRVRTTGGEVWTVPASLVQWERIK